jgi:hypothetical protein
MLQPHPRTKLTKTSSTEDIKTPLDKISHVLESDKPNKKQKVDKKKPNQQKQTQSIYLFSF